MTVLSAGGSGPAPYPTLHLGRQAGTSSLTLARALDIGFAQAGTWTGGWRLQPLQGGDTNLKYPYAEEVPLKVAAENYGLSLPSAKRAGLVSVSGYESHLSPIHNEGPGYFGMGFGTTNLYLLAFTSPLAAHREATKLILESNRNAPDSTVLQGVPGGRLYPEKACSWQKCGGYIFSVTRYVMDGSGDCTGCGSRLLDSEAEAIYNAVVHM
jgi:hypothetical protein